MLSWMRECGCKTNKSEEVDGFVSPPTNSYDMDTGRSWVNMKQTAVNKRRRTKWILAWVHLSAWQRFVGTRTNWIEYWGNNLDSVPSNHRFPPQILGINGTSIFFLKKHTESVSSMLCPDFGSLRVSTHLPSYIWNCFSLRVTWSFVQEQICWSRCVSILIACSWINFVYGISKKFWRREENFV